MSILLSDLRKMTNADIIAAMSAILYESQTFDLMTPNASQAKQLRELVDELEYRFIIRRLETQSSVSQVPPELEPVA